jgi:8-oxo-dGTP diphosphatase
MAAAKRAKNVTEKPRVGVGIIIRRDEEVLLIRREHVHGSGSWSTPGGHLDFGESPEACGVREAEEETGIVVGNVRFRAITNDIFEAERRHYITIWLEADYREGEPLVNAPHEMSEVGWFRWDDLPSPLFLSLANLLDGRCYPPPEEES